MNKFWLKIFVALHNVSYKIISKLAIRLNGGVHPKHKILNYHQFFVDNIRETENIIDIGCGKGENAFDIAGKAKTVLGVDLKSSNIEYAQKHHSKSNLEYKVMDVVKEPLEQKFDKIVLSNVLEHIEQRVEFLIKLSEISDCILLRVPMISRDWLSVYKKNMGLEYRLDPTHFIEYTRSILEDELKSSGWEIENYTIEFGEFLVVIKRK